MISIKVDQFSGDACPCSIFFSCADMLLDLDPNSLSSTKHYKIEVVLDAILNFALYFFIPIHIIEFFFFIF
jgi:hypothetical protein